MATVRVRALQRGYDGNVRREPGDEFDYDIELLGQGKWFEVINEPLQESHEDPRPAKKTSKKRSKKVSRKRRSSADDLLA